MKDLFNVDFLKLFFWFWGSAFLANMMPVLVCKLPFVSKVNKPLDGGRVFGGQRLFGDHKTWAGLLMAPVSGVLFGLIFALLRGGMVSFRELMFFVFVACGAILGDLAKSFFKRRFKIKEGKAWVPFDQLDFIFGGFIFALLFELITGGFSGELLYVYLILLFVAILVVPFLHLGVNFLAYKMGLKKVWW